MMFNDFKKQLEKENIFVADCDDDYRLFDLEDRIIGTVNKEKPYVFCFFDTFADFDDDARRRIYNVVKAFSETGYASRYGSAVVILETINQKLEDLFKNPNTRNYTLEVTDELKHHITVIADEGGQVSARKITFEINYNVDMQ